MRPTSGVIRGICKAAGIGEDWTPRELRHSFVSLLSASGVPVEEIARLVGHSSSRTTEVIYPDGTPPGPGQGGRGHGSDLLVINRREQPCRSSGPRSLHHGLRHAARHGRDNQAAPVKQHIWRLITLMRLTCPELPLIRSSIILTAFTR